MYLSQSAKNKILYIYKITDNGIIPIWSSLRPVRNYIGAIFSWDEFSNYVCNYNILYNSYKWNVLTEKEAFIEIL